MGALKTASKDFLSYAEPLIQHDTVNAFQIEVYVGEVVKKTKKNRINCSQAEAAFAKWGWMRRW